MDSNNQLATKETELVEIQAKIGKIKFNRNLFAISTIGFTGATFGVTDAIMNGLLSTKPEVKLISGLGVVLAADIVGFCLENTWIKSKELHELKKEKIVTK